MSSGNEQGNDAAGTEAPMDSIRLKQILGVAVTNQGLMCLQMRRTALAVRARIADPGSGISGQAFDPSTFVALISLVVNAVA